MFIVPDEMRSEVDDWEFFETTLGKILSDRFLDGRADRAVVDFALRMIRRAHQSIRRSGEPRHSYDLDLPVEAFRAAPSPLSIDRLSCAFLLARWASDLALADESAVRLAAALSIRYPWLGWLLPATLRWIRQVSSADYHATVSLDVHALVLQHIQTVDQDGVSSMYVGELLQEYRVVSTAAK